MSRSIVPSGFETTSHKIFFEYINPVTEITLQKESSSSLRQKSLQKKRKIRSTSPDQSSATEMTSTQLSSTNSSSSSLKTYQDICSICLSSYDNPVTLVSCHHSYCLSCLLLWLNKKPLCPLCKSDGSYFIQSNRYSTSKDDIKLLSINPKPRSISKARLEEIIQIHRRKFPSQLPQQTTDTNPMNKRLKILEKLCDDRLRTSSTDGVLQSTSGEVESQLEHIEHDIQEIHKRLQDLDRVILERKMRKRESRQCINK